MKKRKELTLYEQLNHKVTVSFYMLKLNDGSLVIRMCTNVPGFHTPHLDCSLNEYRLHRKSMKLIGYSKPGSATELYYQPQKILS